MKRIYGMYVFVLLERLAHGVDITFFKDGGFRGESVTVAVNDTACNEVPDDFKNHVSSVNVKPIRTIVVYDGLWCKGNWIKVNNAGTNCTGIDFSCNTSSIVDVTKCLNDCDHPFRYLWNDEPKSFRMFGLPGVMSFDLYSLKFDREWYKISSVTSCSDTNDCPRDFTVQVTKVMTMTKAMTVTQEFTSDRKLRTYSSYFTEEVTRELNEILSSHIQIWFMEVGSSAGHSRVQTVDKTSRTSFVVNSTRGTTVTYSTSNEVSMRSEETVQCDGGTENGFYTEYRANALVVNGSICLEDMCGDLQLKLLPYNHDGVMTADFRCVTINPDRCDCNGNAQKQNGRPCRTLNQTCDGQNKCCDTGLECFQRYDLIWDEGTCSTRRWG